MTKLGKNELFKIAGVTQYSQFDSFIKDTLFDPERRNQFYKDILDVNSDVYVDTFRDYFEEYAAERKANKQDYTPDSVGKLLATITDSDIQGSDGWSGYDPTAGTGSLLIQKWKNDQLKTNPLTDYAPHDYLYRADEIADNAIPYLLHNLALRGMNCIVVHGDVLEGTVKQIYFVQNSKDDFLSFSDINVMPHTDDIKSEFNVKEWLEEPINHIESRVVKFIPTIKEQLSVIRNDEEQVLVG